MSEIRPFEFKIGERELSVKLGELVCVMFRAQQEVDYLAVKLKDDEEEKTVLRIFNNTKLVRYLGGLTLHEDGNGLTTDDGDTFKDEYGWNPPVIIKERPNEEELEWFMDVNAGQIDQEWEAQG